MTDETPFEADCRRKKDGHLEFRNVRARLNTCKCGIIRACHYDEVVMKRCKGFTPMTEKEWAEWIGVEG